MKEDGEDATVLARQEYAFALMCVVAGFGLGWATRDSGGSTDWQHNLVLHHRNLLAEALSTYREMLNEETRLRGLPHGGKK